MQLNIFIVDIDYNPCFVVFQTKNFAFVFLVNLVDIIRNYSGSIKTLGCTKTNTSGHKSDGIIYLKELGKMSQ